MNTLNLNSARTGPMHRRMDTWAEARDIHDKLNRALRLEALFLRSHRLLGGSIVAGTVYVLGSWMHAYDRMQVMSVLAPVTSVAVLIHLLVLLLGAVIATRPRLIQDLLITALGARATDEYGPQNFAAMLASEFHAAEQQLVMYARLLGLVMMCGGTYAALALYPALLSLFSA